MDTKEIDEKINSYIKEIDDEVKETKSIQENATLIANKLLGRNSKLIVDIDGIIYAFQYKILKTKEKRKRYVKSSKELVTYLAVVEYINMVIIDQNKSKISSGKYGIYTAKNIIDKQLTMQENLKINVEAFIKHIKGIIDVEEEI